MEKEGIRRYVANSRTIQAFQAHSAIHHCALVITIHFRIATETIIIFDYRSKNVSRVIAKEFSQEDFLLLAANFFVVFFYCSFFFFYISASSR